VEGTAVFRLPGYCLFINHNIINSDALRHHASIAYQLRQINPQLTSLMEFATIWPMVYQVTSHTAAAASQTTSLAWLSVA
jgi:hypothetical protein